MNINSSIQTLRNIIAQDYDHEIPDKVRSQKFNAAYTRLMKSMFAGRGVEVVNHKGCYCEPSGFLKKGDKYVYYNAGDFRYEIMGHEGWKNNILIRTATSETDYTGGRNNYTTLDRLVNDVLNLFERN